MLQEFVKECSCLLVVISLAASGSEASSAIHSLRGTQTDTALQLVTNPVDVAFGTEFYVRSEPPARLMLEESSGDIVPTGTPAPAPTQMPTLTSVMSVMTSTAKEGQEAQVDCPSGNILEDIPGLPCDSWANNGQCLQNPTFMLANCPHRCSTVVDQPSPTPLDHQHQCDDWAEHGECTKNSAYMEKACAQSCTQLGVPITDTPPPPQHNVRCTKRSLRQTCPHGGSFQGDTLPSTDPRLHTPEYPGTCTCS